MSCVPSGHHIQGIQIQVCHGVLGQGQMRQMRWVKGTAVKPQLARGTWFVNEVVGIQTQSFRTKKSV